MTTRMRDLLKDYLNQLPWQTRLQLTLPMGHVSPVLHEPAILSGYRVPNKPWRYYFYSLFQLHNETVNVWSHLIGALVIVHELYQYSMEMSLVHDHVARTLLAFGVTCLVGLLTSSVVHLVHGKCPEVHFVAFMYDYIGAAACTFGTGLLSFYGISDKTYYKTLESVYLPLLTLSVVGNFIILCLAKLWYGHDPHNMNRKYMMLGGMLGMSVVTGSCFFPRYLTCMRDESCSLSSLNHLTVIPVVFFLQALTFASHQPERTWPGKFDIVGHGHQIFHVLIVVNHVFQMNAAYKDYRNGLNSHCDPNLTAILITLVAIYMTCVLIVEYLRQYVPDALKRAADAHEH